MANFSPVNSPVEYTLLIDVSGQKDYAIHNARASSRGALMLGHFDFGKRHLCGARTSCVRHFLVPLPHNLLCDVM